MKAIAVRPSAKAGVPHGRAQPDLRQGSHRGCRRSDDPLSPQQERVDGILGVLDGDVGLGPGLLNGLVAGGESKQYGHAVFQVQTGLEAPPPGALPFGVGVPAEQVQDQVPQDRSAFCGMARPSPIGVLPEGHVEGPVKPVLDAPMEPGTPGSALGMLLM